MAHDELSRAVVEALADVCGGERPVALHEPDITALEIERVGDCLRSGWISTAGEYGERFEAQLCEITGAAHAIAVVNGTAALKLALLAAGVGPGDAVLVPTLSFVASANAVSHCGAMPYFVDSEATTLGVDAAALARHLEEKTEAAGGGRLDPASGRTIRALVAVHVLGHPADLDAIAALCERFGLALVEDAAEALGSRYRGAHVGHAGRLAALSFNGNKIVSTGGGGAVLCNDAALAERVRHVSSTARTPHPWETLHDEIGFNDRLPALNAALGSAQLERLDALLAAKRALAGRYAERFARVAGVDLFPEADGVQSNHWLNGLMLAEPDRAARDAVLAASNAAGLQTRPAWALLHTLPMYTGCPRTPTPGAQAIADRLVMLPSSARLGR